MEGQRKRSRPFKRAGIFRAAGQRKRAKPVDTDGKKLHRIKVLHKALKKARDFEIRKVSRRLRQVQEAATDGGKKEQKVQSDAPGAVVAKLQLRLEAVKGVDLSSLTQQAAMQSGLVDEVAATPLAGVESSAANVQAVQAVLHAKCVQKEVEAIRKQISDAEREAQLREKRIRKAQEKLSRAAELAANSAETAGRRADSGGESAEEVDEDDGPEPPAGRQPEGTAAADRIASDALQKMLARSAHAAHSSGEDNDEDSDRPISRGEDSDFSGSESELEEGSLLSEPSSDAEYDLADVALREDDQNQAQATVSGAKATPAEERQQTSKQSLGTQRAAKKTKKDGRVAKPKNRMGQRARRRIAVAQFGPSARHIAEKRGSAVPPASASKNPKPATTAASSGEALHPSWAAKRRERAQLAIPAAPMQKIVFDKTGSAGQQKQGPQTQGTFHPSWEAKKALAKKMQAMTHAQGKKTVFSED